MDIVEPTDVQSSVIPQVLQGVDVIARSPTGTGKTLAYLLPAMQNLDDSAEMQKRVQVLVLTPSYELAAQVASVAKGLWEAAETQGVPPVLLVGGANISRQIEVLKTKPRVVVGTPGRVMELIEMKKLTGHFIKTLVLDEYDKLFEKNNAGHIEAIVKATPRSRQTLLFSATSASVPIALNNAVQIYVGAKVPQTIRHMAVICERRDKFKAVRKFINREEVSKAIIFVRDATAAVYYAEKLNHHGIPCFALGAGIGNAERKTALEHLRNGKIRVMAATDAAARGLDISGLQIVFNADPPFNADEYLHRAGRVGRINNFGEVITFISGNERVGFEKIMKKLNLEAGVSYERF